MSTKISEQTNDRIRTTLPKAIVDETGFHDFDTDDQKTAIQIGCGGDRPEITVRFGPGIDDGPATTTPTVSSSTGQVQIEFPMFMARAWGLIDCRAAWEDGSVTIGDEIVTVTAAIDGWESSVSLDPFALATGEAKRATIQRAGDEVENTIAMLPTEAVRTLGIERGDGTRLEPTFTCQSDRVWILLSPTDKTRDESTLGRSVVFAGPDNSQPRISAGEIAVALGVTDILERGDSVPMQWVVQGDELVGFVDADAGV